MTPHAEKAILLAADGIATGSIVRIYAPASAIVNDCTFGQFVEGGDNIDYQSTTTNIAIPAGTYLEGPFTQIHMNNVATVVYYNGGSLSVS